MAFGLVLREERVRQRLSQDDLAALSGVGRVSIGDLEAGKGCGPSYYVGTKLARALGLYFDVLVKRARVMVEA